MNALRGNSWMWAEACALLDEAERRHQRFFNLLAVPSTPPAWEPPANIFSVGPDLHVVVALPGARPDEVLVQITATGLLVETAVAPAFPVGANVVRLEIPHGRMRRRIELPAGRYELREHRLERGNLYLRLTGAPL